MKTFLKVALMAIALLVVPTFAKADTTVNMQLTGVNGATTPNGADYVGPYTLSVNGTPENLFCLDLNRDITMGETWDATATTLSTSSSLDLKTAAIILNEINAGSLSDTDGQLMLWALNDPSGAQADGLPIKDMNLLAFDESLATSPLYGNSFYNQFTDYVAVDGTQSSGGEAQDFLGEGVHTSPSPTPEPGSLALLGTGLLGVAGVAKRKYQLLG